MEYSEHRGGDSPRRQIELDQSLKGCCRLSPGMYDQSESLSYPGDKLLVGAITLRFSTKETMVQRVNCLGVIEVDHVSFFLVNLSLVLSLTALVQQGWKDRTIFDGWIIYWGTSEILHNLAFRNLAQETYRSQK